MKFVKKALLFIILSTLFVGIISCTQIRSFEWQDGGGVYFTLQPTYKGISESYSADITKTDKAIYYADKKKESIYMAVKSDLKIVFDFSHDSYCSELLLHAYIKGIKMKQGVCQQWKLLKRRNILIEKIYILI